MTDHLDPAPAPEDNPFWRALGITPTFQDEATAPAVDLEKLRRYYRQELSEPECREVRQFAGRYRSWFMALNDVVRARGESQT